MMGNWMLGIPDGVAENGQAAAEFISWMSSRKPRRLYAQNQGIPSPHQRPERCALAEANPYFPALAEALAAPPNWRPRTDQWNAVETSSGPTSTPPSPARRPPTRRSTSVREEIRQHHGRSRLSDTGHSGQRSNSADRSARRSGPSCPTSGRRSTAATDSGPAVARQPAGATRPPAAPARPRHVVVVVATIPFVLALHPSVTDGERAVRRPRELPARAEEPATPASRARQRRSTPLIVLPTEILLGRRWPCSSTIGRSPLAAVRARSSSWRSSRSSFPGVASG